tara:strand:- start:107 stop:1579 length:1473 start_codon:yes stop_codon:yes gene_type:complete
MPSQYVDMVLITEIKWKTTQTEFIELYNRTDEAINIEGWEINAIKWGTANGSVGYGFPEYWIQPKEYLILVANPAFDSWNELCLDREWAQAYCPECNISGTNCDEDLQCFLNNGCQIPGHPYTNGLQWPQPLSGHTGGGTGGLDTNSIVGYDCENNPTNCNCPGQSTCNGSGAILNAGELINLRDAEGGWIHSVHTANLRDILLPDCLDDTGDDCFYDGGGVTDNCPGGVSYCQYGEYHPNQNHRKYRNTFEMIDPDNYWSCSESWYCAMVNQQNPGTCVPLHCSDETSCSTWQLSRFMGGTPGAGVNKYLSGCDDPMANNYNPGAPVVCSGQTIWTGVQYDGSCTYDHFEPGPGGPGGYISPPIGGQGSQGYVSPRPPVRPGVRARISRNNYTEDQPIEGKMIKNHRQGKDIHNQILKQTTSTAMLRHDAAKNAGVVPPTSKAAIKSAFNDMGKKNVCPPGTHWMPPTNGKPGYCMKGDTHPNGYENRR